MAAVVTVLCLVVVGIAMFYLYTAPTWISVAVCLALLPLVPRAFGGKTWRDLI